MIGGLSSILPALGQMSPYADDDELMGGKKPKLNGPKINKALPTVLPTSKSDQRPVASPAMSGMPAVSAPAVEQVAPRLNMDRTGVALPTFPGEIGGPREWSPMEQQRYDDTSGFVNKLPGAGATDRLGKAKFDAMMEGVKRDNMNRIVPGEMEGLGWKGILGNALRGFAQAASANPENALGAGLGGAATAGIISGISPTEGREYAFDQGEGRKIEREMQRERQLGKEAYEATLRELGIQGAQADLDSSRARTDATRAGMPDRDTIRRRDEAEIEGVQARTKATVAGMKDAELSRRKLQAEIDRINAQTEAFRTGKPTYMDIDNNGVIQKVQVFPDGTIVPIGKSGKAAIDSQRIQTQKDTADKNRESRERTAAQQRNRLGGGPLSDQSRRFSLSREAAEMYAKEKGISLEQAATIFQKKGITIK